MPAPVMVMNRALTDRDPTENVQRAVSALQSLSCEIWLGKGVRFRMDPKTGLAANWSSSITEIRMQPEHGFDLAKAEKVVDALFAGATDDSIHIWLSDLSEVAARASSTAEEGVLTLSAYTDRLRSYPGDVVRFVLRDWGGHWFPTWAELKAEIDTLMAPRHALRAELNRLKTPAIAFDATGERLRELRDQAASAERLMAKYPDLAESSARRLEEIVAEIARLEPRS